MQDIIKSIVSSQDGPEGAASRLWGTILKRDADGRAKLCDEIEAFFTARLKQQEQQQQASHIGPSTPPKTPATLHFFVEVYLASLYAICKKLATPFVWESAQTSPVREKQAVLPESRHACNTAAIFIVHICEDYLLRSRDAAQLCFRCLLAETGMGIPLLTLVLYAYATAAADVLSSSENVDESHPDSVGRCLEYLGLASEIFTLEDDNRNKDQLTVVHPIFLHVARVSGRVQDGLRFFQKPVRFVNPILTGVGLADYVTYYAEAALLLLLRREYASAFYALTPVHSLLSMQRLVERARTSNTNSGSSNSDAVEPYFSAAKAACADGESKAAKRSSSSASDASANSTARREEHQQQQTLSMQTESTEEVRLYPWYRTKPVSATHIFSATAEHGGEEVVEWRLILAPSPAEMQRDERVRAWAVRLSLLLLIVAFGGGNPREIIMACGEFDSMPTDAECEEVVVDWRGVDSSAIKGHVCFPNTVFYLLSQTTRVQLGALLAAAIHSFAPETQVYLSLLVAVAQRDVAHARSLLTSPHNSALIADMTLHLAQVAVEEYLPRHIVLDVARMYSRVPLRLLIERTGQRPSNGKDEQQHNHARAVLTHMAHLCATGELQSCHMYTTVTSADPTGTTTSIDSIVAAEGFEQRPLDIEATSISFAVSPVSKCVLICSRIVSQQPLSCNRNQGGNNFDGSTTPNAALLQMLAQLQTLQRVLEDEQGNLKKLYARTTRELPQQN